MKKLFMAVLVITILASVRLFVKKNFLEKVKKDGYFTEKIGLDATFAPMGFRDENEEILGFDIDLAKEVAKRMGVEVKFKPCEFLDGIVFDLRSKSIDMVWNGTTITE